MHILSCTKMWLRYCLGICLIQAITGQQPSLVTGPQGVENSDGDEVVLDCKFDGPAKECVWLKDGEITIIREPYQYVDDPEKGDCSIRIAHVDLGRDDGLWTCQYPRFGNFPAVVSKEARVTVLIPPEEPLIFYDGEVIEKGGTLSVERLGENVTILCLSKHGNPASSIHWMVDGHRLEGVNHNESAIGPNNLKIFNSQSELMMVAGSHLRGSQVKCIAEHPTYHGVLHESYAYILVHHNTTHVSATVDGGYITSLEVNEMQEVTFYCLADGVPEPTYTWEFMKQGGEKWEIMANSQNFTFSAIAGKLFCKAGNEYNVEHVRSVMEITVDTKAPPTKGNSAAVSLTAGSLFHLVCFIIMSNWQSVC